MIVLLLYIALKSADFKMYLHSFALLNEITSYNFLKNLKD